MEELSLNRLLEQNDLLHRKLARHRELLQIYRGALKQYARKYPEQANMSIAEEALEKGKKLEKLL